MLFAEKELFKMDISVGEIEERLKRFFLKKKEEKATRTVSRGGGTDLA